MLNTWLYFDDFFQNAPDKITPLLEVIQLISKNLQIFLWKNMLQTTNRNVGKADQNHIILIKLINMNQCDIKENYLELIKKEK